MMSTGRCSREAGKQCNDSGGGHLGKKLYKAPFPPGITSASGGNAHHPKLAAYFVRDPAKNEHTDDCACESHAGQRLAVVVVCHGIGIQFFQN